MKILLVEGEKCVDALRQAQPTWKVMTWPGGANGVKHVDWSPLQGHDVVVWADHDEAGSKAADAILDIIGGRKIDTWADDPSAHPAGYDVADLIAEGGDPAEYIREHLGSERRPPANQTPAEASYQPTQETAVEPPQNPQKALPTVGSRPIPPEGAHLVGLIKAGKDHHDHPGSTYNTQRWLEWHPQTYKVFAFNTLTHAIDLLWCPPWDKPEGWRPRQIMDTDYTGAAVWLERKTDVPGWRKQIIVDAIMAIAKDNAYDPLVQYLEGVKWDGVPRLSTMLTTHFGVADSAYAQTVSRKFMISAAARGLCLSDDGIKVDVMLVLEGPQGIRKSSSIKALFGTRFTKDSMPDLSNQKESIIHLQGAWAVEMAEMVASSRAEADMFKAFLTRDRDDYRPHYARHEISTPRRCVFVGTINPDGLGWAKDQTGNRRFWPVEAGEIDVDAIERDRDQLWAEAVAAYRAGEAWWMGGVEIIAAEAVQKSRLEYDPWTGKLAEIAALAGDRVHMNHILSGLEIPMEKVGSAQQRRIVGAMRRIGYDVEQGPIGLVFYQGQEKAPPKRG